MKIDIVNLSKRYVVSFQQYMVKEGIQGEPEDIFELFKQSLEDSLKVYRIRRYSKLVSGCSKSLKKVLNIAPSKVSLADRVKIIELSLAYFVAGDLVGGMEMSYYKVYTKDTSFLGEGSFYVGSDLQKDRLDDMLYTLFPLGYSCKKVSNEEVEDFVMFSSINSAKVNFKGMLGIVYVESSNQEIRGRLENLLGKKAA